MKKIIRHGTPKTEEPKSATCTKCGCEFTFEISDVDYEKLPTGGTQTIVRCPERKCRHKIPVD